MLSDNPYEQRILEHVDAPFHRGRCPGCTHAHQDDNPLCGDQVRLELCVDDRGKLADAWFDGDGCCVSQAAASMLVEHIEGLTVEDIRKISARDMLDLFGARLTPNRQKCCLLAWRVLQSALHSPIEAADCSPGPS